MPIADPYQAKLRDALVGAVETKRVRQHRRAVARGVAFAMAGLANPVFWGVTTTLFASLPVVGSGLVKVIAEAGKGPDLTEKVESYVRWLKNGGEGIDDNRRTQAADRSTR